MKLFHKFFTLLAVAGIAHAPIALGGEVKKKPLKIEQAVQLFEEQKEDLKELKLTEAGRSRGSGLLGLAAAAAAGYFIYDQVSDEGVEEYLGIKK